MLINDPEPTLPTTPLPEVPVREYRPRLREFGKAAFMNLFSYFPILVLHDEAELAKAQAVSDGLHARPDLVDGEYDYLDLLDLTIENFAVTSQRFADNPVRSRPARQYIDPLSTLSVVALAVPGLVDAGGRAVPASPLAEEPEPFHAPEESQAFPGEPDDLDDDGPSPNEELSEQAKADLATLKVQAGVPERKPAKNRRGRR